jgi:hypothetical protein
MHAAASAADEHTSPWMSSRSQHPLSVRPPSPPKAVEPRQPLVLPPIEYVERSKPTDEPRQPFPRLNNQYRHRVHIQVDEVHWQPLIIMHLLDLLHHPIYPQDLNKLVILGETLYP